MAEIVYLGKPLSQLSAEELRELAIGQDYVIARLHGEIERLREYEWMYKSLAK